MTVGTLHPRMVPASARRVGGGALVAGCLTAAAIGCRSVTADGCASSAQRVGWKVIVVSAACDISIVWITPTPSTLVSGGEP
jgi:hypothetical protein